MVFTFFPNLLRSYIGIICFHPLHYLGILSHRWGASKIDPDLPTGLWFHQEDWPHWFVYCRLSLRLLGSLVGASLDLASAMYSSCCMPPVLLRPSLGFLSIFLAFPDETKVFCNRVLQTIIGGC